MTIWIQIGIVLEVIIVNMLAYSLNSKRIKSRMFTIFVLSMYSVVLIIVGLAFLKQFHFYGNGNGIFTWMGFLYLPVLRVLYNENNRHNFFTICCAWIYTLTIFSVSVQIGYILSFYGRFLMTFVAETILFVVTLKPMIMFMKTRYIPLLACRDNALHYYLNREIFIWFITIFLVNLNFIFESVAILKIIALLAILLNVVLSFNIIHEILDRGKLIGSLKQEVMMDSLTMLGNRSALINHLTMSMKQEKSFSIIFLDLDDFKGINDEFGHIAGDQYLIAFSTALENIKSGKAFRVSGDEFIISCAQDQLESTLKRIADIHYRLMDDKVHFRGVSYGVAQFPLHGQDIDDLIRVADRNMYEHKVERKADRGNKINERS